MAEKTNAMRRLESLKISYKEHFYQIDEAISGVEVAAALSENVGHVFKTLVTSSKSGSHYVFMIPAAEELDLKKAAAVVGEKYVEMLKSKDLLGLTGYIHGGCSPIGMKKYFRTVIDKKALDFDTIIFSGGRIGYQIELSAETLSKAVKTEYADVTKQRCEE